MADRRLEGLMLLAAVTAIKLSRDLSADQLELLSAFFEVLGDDLALLATALPENENCK